MAASSPTCSRTNASTAHWPNASTSYPANTSGFGGRRSSSVAETPESSNEQPSLGAAAGGGYFKLAARDVGAQAGALRRGSSGSDRPVARRLRRPRAP